ncbi:hypothetical protein GGX14DRAFT_443394, partial [Mycena pura]
MHRALQIAEIVDLICSQIATQIHRDASRPDWASGDLAALARTSKNFLDPALNGLWSYQDTFLPILLCMPGDLWDGPVFNVVDSLNLARSIVPTDWDRPLFYLHRVKHLSITDYMNMPSQDLFDTFSLCLPTDHFFPNLRSLEWTNVNSALFHNIRLLLGPNITDLQITFTDDIPCLSFIPMIAAKYPDLRSADLYCEFAEFRPESRELETISLFARGLKCIETLSVDALDGSAFAHLSTLPTLESLTVMNLCAFSFAPSQPDIPGFIGLTTLIITATTDKAAISCVKALSQSPLAKVFLCMDFETTPKFVSLLYASVVENISHATLRSLDIQATDDPQWPAHPPSSPERSAVFRTALRHLFCFGSLTRAELTTTGGFHLDDALLVELAHAWPNMQHLTLLAEDRSCSGSRATLSGLRSLAYLCPGLVILGLELEASVIPSPYSHVDRKPPSRLSDLCVGFSPIFEPSLVAYFLVATFPEIKQVSTGLEHYHMVVTDRERDSFLYTNRWIEVHDKLTKLRKATS